MPLKKLLFLLCAASLFVAPQGSYAKELLLGTQGPETGPIATSGLQIFAGVKLAVKEINQAGGINGMQIKLINVDSRGDKLEAVNASKKLINNKVCGIAGDLSSGAIFAIRDVVNRSKTPLISSGATAQGATDGREFIFRNILLDADGAPAAIDYVMDNKGWKDFVIITSMNNDSSVALTEIFKNHVAKRGGKVVAEQTVFDGDTDMSAQITSLKGKKFDALIYTGYYQEASLLLLEMRRQKMMQTIIGGDGIMFPDLWKVAGDAAIGTIFFSGYAPDYPDKQVELFNKKIKTMNAEPDAFAAQGYDAVYLFADAMKKAGVTDCSDAKQRQKIRDILAETKDFEGVSGKMSFDKEGNAVKRPFIQEVMKDSNGYRTRLLNK